MALAYCECQLCFYRWINYFNRYRYASVKFFQDIFKKPIDFYFYIVYTYINERPLNECEVTAMKKINMDNMSKTMRNNLLASGRSFTTNNMYKVEEKDGGFEVVKYVRDGYSGIFENTREFVCEWYW